MKRCLFAAVLVVTLWFGVPAHAHQPVFVDASNRVAATAPLLVDGTVSFAVYGTFDRGSDTRAIKVGFRKGDALVADLLVPLQPPESTLKPNALPTMTITDPAGKVVTLPTFKYRITFYEPVSRTSYMYVARTIMNARKGEYVFTVTSNSPARFTLAIGEREVRGEVQGGSSRGYEAVAEWWRKPPSP